MITIRVSWDDHESTYVRTLDECPWSRLPVSGDRVDVGGDLVEVQSVFFKIDGDVELYLRHQGDFHPYQAEALEEDGFSSD